ncbi:MAG: patatin-like phospholipase family protein [Gammaproteobacteria bacterium]|nr:patatin-like phospholipase family protein [Gammaproteobacteria bacterium]
MKEEVSHWLEFLDLRIGHGGPINSEAMMAFLAKRLRVTQFEQLKIPMTIVATDFWGRSQVVLDSGNLISAINASMAIPGLFEPVKYRGKVLVDGGLVNPVPYDLLFDDCDVVVAINVLGERTPDSRDTPGYFETTFNTFQILQNSILNEKLRHRRPDIYIKPDIRDIRMLDFNKVSKIYQQAETARKELAAQLHPYSTQKNT